MVWFGVSVVTMLGVALAMLLPALQNRRPINQNERKNENDSRQHNIAVAQQRIAELESADDDNASAVRSEIELALLDDLDNDDALQTPQRASTPTLSKFILAMIPLLSIAIYFQLGDPHSLTGTYNNNSSVSEAPSPIAIELLLEKLEEKLAAAPGDAEGWALAGRTYMHIGEFEKAELAFQTLHQLVGDNADVLAAWAEASALANHGNYSTQTMERIARALALQPTHEKALWSAAAGAEFHGEYLQAVNYLQQLLPVVVATDNQRTAEQVTQWITRLEKQELTKQTRENSEEPELQADEKSGE